jgi:hypothetical protein
MKAGRAAVDNGSGGGAVKVYEITLRVKVLHGDIGEHIAGIKEDAAASIEKKGAGIVAITTREVRTQEPRQLSFRDMAPPLSAPPPPPPLSPPLQRPKKPRAPKPEFTPPPREEAIPYCMERGLTQSQAEQWYDDKVRGGWTWGREVLHPLKDWKADVNTRARQLDADAREHAKKPKPEGYAPSFDLEAYERMISDPDYTRQLLEKRKEEYL